MTFKLTYNFLRQKTLDNNKLRHTYLIVLKTYKTITIFDQYELIGEENDSEE